MLGYSASTLGSWDKLLVHLGVQQAALGQAASELGRADIGTMATLGGARQANEQARLDAARATQLQETMAPYQQLGFLSDIYKGAPTTQMALTSSSAPSPSPITQALGLGIQACRLPQAPRKLVYLRKCDEEQSNESPYVHGRGERRHHARV
jgi:hypothetical protein